MKETFPEKVLESYSVEPVHNDPIYAVMSKSNFKYILYFCYKIIDYIFKYFCPPNQTCNRHVSCIVRHLINGLLHTVTTVGHYQRRFHHSKHSGQSTEMAFTFAAFSYIAALIIDAFLLFFSIFHVSWSWDGATPESRRPDERYV